MSVDVINPDLRDLQMTASLIRAVGLEQRCRLFNCVAEDAPFTSASFDAITSISVVEHIPRDREVLAAIWSWLKPGGRLVVSVPCSSSAEEQYVNVDHFGIQQSDNAGFYFLQYVYDEELLEERFYSVVGTPTRFVVYGEREPGSLRCGLIRKWSGDKYPRWKEPYIMAREFRRYSSVVKLPGEGVIIMLFEKK